MEKCYNCLFQKLLITIFLIIFSGLFTQQAFAWQADRPFSVDLNAGGGLIGNSTTHTAFQPELGLSYMPGRWGAGLTAGLYSFDSGFSADQYRTGYEQFTVTEASENQWEAFYLNAGPRFEQSLSRFVSMNLGLDLAMNYQEAPSQTVRFYDSTGEMESSGVDSDLVLAEMDAGDNAGGWSAAIRPQMQLDFKPGFSDRFSINIKTGIQHHLSDREITYSERDLSRVMQVDSPFEMHHQFENAPIIQRSETAPKTNFFANAGIKISFGGSSNRGLHPEGVIHRDIASRASSGARDYNSSRSNKPSSEAVLDDVVIVKGEGLTAVASFIDEIIDVLDGCEDEVCSRVRQNADGRVDKYRQVREGQISQDQGIEDIHSIVMEDVVSLQTCETDVCREVLSKEVQLLEHMNVLMSLVQSGRAATARDYNSSRSNKPSSRADDVDGGGDDAGHQAVLITQDEEGKVYAWGGAPEAIIQDENGKLYSWGSNYRVSPDGGEGKVYSWGVASSASLQSGDGEVYCWGDNSKASLQDGDGNVYCWGNNSRTSVDSCEGDSCPQPGSDALYLAKELGLASVGDDIEQIKQVLDRCEEGVCGQVGQNADERHHGVTRAQENPSEFDTQIEEILNIVKEDVESLGRCETDFCREVLAMEEKLLVKMNRLNELAQIAPAQDYNSSRSNKPGGSIANDGIGDGDPDSDDDGIDDAVETAQDYNSSRSNKPRTEDGRGGDDEIIRDAVRMARLANPSGQIISAGVIMMGTNNPLHEGETAEGENPLYEGQANNGDSGDESYGDPLAVQRFDLQPSSYCVALSTMKISTNSQQSMRSGAQNSKPDMDGDGFPEIMTGASMTAKGKKALGRMKVSDVTLERVNDDLDSDGYDEMVGFQFDLEVDPLDTDDDGDGLGDVLENATFSISKRSARTGRSAAAGGKEIETMEWNEGTARQMASDDDPCGPGVWARTTGGSENCIPENSEQENPLAQESGRQETPVLENIPPGNVYQWTYNLTSLTDAQEIPGGTLTVLFTGGTWHFNVHIDPDDDGDGYGDLLQNSSFSISKRSARTGRNP